MLRQIMLVGLGSAVGGIFRFIMGKWIYFLYPQKFPLPTLIINILGCFLIGLLYGFSIKTGTLSAEVRLLLTTGLCGGFTTFSAFAYENIQLMKNGDYTMVLVYITASVVLGIVAAFLGMAIYR
jgi:fluoride exporter